nr:MULTISPECIES: transposase [unclassified Ruegeria]
MHYLWRAVDHEGEVLEAVVAKRRNKAVALKFLKKLTKRHGKAKTVVSDRFASCRAVL